MANDSNTGKLEVKIESKSKLHVSEVRRASGQTSDGMPISVSVRQYAETTPPTLDQAITLHVPGPDGYHYYVSTALRTAKPNEASYCAHVGSTWKAVTSEPSKLLKDLKPELYESWKKAKQQIGNDTSLKTQDVMVQKLGGNPNDDQAQAVVCYVGTQAKLALAALPVLTGKQGETISSANFDELATIARRALQAVNIVPQVPATGLVK